MMYIALLRGINVGGHSKIEMRELKELFESAGMSRVRTYINSGNVIFEHKAIDANPLGARLVAAIEKRFGFHVRVLVHTRDEIASVVKALPDEWTNDDRTRCDVIFLWPQSDDPSALGKLDFDPAHEDVRYTPGAVIRKVDRSYAPHSRLTRVVGTPLYEDLTIRNCNTTRKLLALLDE